MSRAMGRGVATCALALAVGGGMNAAEARGAPDKGFAGRYSGTWPGAFSPWPIQISSSGDVSAKFRESSNSWGTSQGGYGLIHLQVTQTGEMTGSLGPDGALSVAGDVTQEISYSFKSHPELDRVDFWTFHFERTATVAPDADGNLTGVSDAGESFVWYRK
jgi:hypothetical protein